MTIGKKQDPDGTRIPCCRSVQRRRVRCTISPELHRERGNHIARPLVPGSTAKEMGLSTKPEDYSHSYIWVPDHGFQNIDPNRNMKPDRSEIPGRGIELPVVRELESRFPDNDIFVIKYGPGETTLDRDWNPNDRTASGPATQHGLDPIAKDSGADRSVPGGPGDWTLLGSGRVRRYDHGSSRHGHT